MSIFLKEIFPTMLLSGQANDLSICEKAVALALEFKSTAKDATLVSDKWNSQIASSDQADFDKHGVTSYNSGCLLEKSEWKEVVDYVQHFASTMVGSVSGGQKQLKLINMWLTVYPADAFVPAHVHSNSLLSGVLYVKAEKDCGNIVFQDPAYIAKTMFINGSCVFPTPPTNFAHTPETGNMVIFPSWLPHATQPNKSGENRIMISFNMDMVAP